MVPIALLAEVETFSLSSVASLAGVSAGTLRAWLTKGLIRASGGRGRQLVFTFVDLTVAVLVAGLKQRGVSTARIGACAGQTASNLA